MTRAAPVAVALVGPGMIAEYHLGGLAATGRAEVKAIVGRRAESARDLAQRFAVETVTTRLSEVLSRDDVDALVVTTPDDTHEAITVAAIEAGKAVLLQKPMANCLTAAQRIVDAAVSAGVDLQVSFMHRYFDEVVLARQLIANGVIGEVTSARMRNATPGPDWAAWFFDADRVGSGVVAQLGVHGIDLLSYLFGPMQSVSALLRTVRPQRRLADGRNIAVHNPDTGIATYTFASGMVASHEMSMIEVAGCDRFRLEIYGTKGTMWLRSERGLLAWVDEKGEWSVPTLPASRFGRVQHDRWLDGLTQAQPPEATAREALAGMQVLEAIAASAAADSARLELGAP